MPNICSHGANLSWNHIFSGNCLANNNALISMKKDVVQQKSYFTATVVCHAITTISESYKQEMRRKMLKRNNFQKTLEESPYYQDGPNWELLLKSRRRAKCSSTKYQI